MLQSINTLVRKQLTGHITPEEQLQLDDWLANHPETAHDYEQLLDGRWFSERYDTYAQVDGERAWEQFRSSHFPAQSSVSKRLWRRWATAAAVLLLVTAGALVWLRQYTKVVPPVLGQKVQSAMQQSELAGRVEAVVESIPLSLHKEAEEPSRPVHSTAPSPADEDGKDAVKQLLAAKRITTRSDKEFWLTLPDGTMVHLNYNTSVIYPQQFTGDTREVYVEGEAYFMVSRDRRHPFVVHTSQVDVRVYGTEFVVSTWREESGKWREGSGVGEDGNSTEVVLVRGSLGVTPAGGEEQMLRPGQKCSMQNNQCSIEDVDTAPYVAWNEGMFMFTDWPLERIVSVLARWYGKEFSFADDELRHVKLSGNLYRYDEIGPTMRALEKAAGVTVRQSQNVLTIDY